MIKLRLNSIAGSSETLPFVPGERIEDVVIRALEGKGYPTEGNFVDSFIVILEGKKIDREFWRVISVKENDNILIAPNLMSGDTGQIFRQVATIAIVIAASSALGPGGLGLTGFSLGFAVAGVSVATGLVLNALIPPASLDQAGFGDIATGGYTGSQMFNVTAQGNTAKRYGNVPKVYGTYRLFPSVAANAYTEIEADPETGALVQFFYCIYDFGLGPCMISDLQIGETPIGNFGETTNPNSDLHYRLVDLNKPVVSEGVWDDLIHNSFTMYKGDVETDASPITLNVNSTDSGAFESDYKVIRNASSSVNGSSQEISLDFINPRGLISFGTNGDTAGARIELEIKFSKVGEDNWVSYNDPSYVSYFKTVGGKTEYEEVTLVPHPFSVSVYPQIAEISNLTTLNLARVFTNTVTSSFGVASGSTIILSDGVETLIDEDEIEYDVEYAIPGDTIFFNGDILGKIVTKAPHATPGYSIYTLEFPIPTPLDLYTATSINAAPYSNSIPTNKSILSKKLTFGKAIIERKNTEAVYSTFKFKPREIAQFKVRVTRVTSSSPLTYQVRTELTLASLATRFDRSPIITDKRHVFLELKIRATNQLNGAIQNLSGVVSSVLDVYDTGTQTWSKEVTSNPAWVLCDLLTGPVNRKAIDKSKLHLPSISEWAEFCDEIPTSPPGFTYVDPRFSMNFVLDFSTTLQQLLSSVGSASQASMNIIDGKYGVLIDKLRTVPVQIFTPRNSWGFFSSRQYLEPPHGMQVKYTDPAGKWQQNQKTVYTGTYDETTASVFEEINTFGCTNADQAWRFGRYMIAQATLRQEIISLNVDFEYLVCTRGDFVQITQDVMKAGGRPARVISLSGNTIKIDDGIDTDNLLSYGYVFRSVTGIYTNTLTVVDSSHFTLDGTLPSPGDLIIIGEVGSVVLDCIVKSIHPSSDLTAQITLVEKADAIYSVESTGVIPEYLPILSLTQDSTNTAPGEVQNLEIVDNTWRFTGSGYEYYITLDWDVPVGSAYETFEIYVDRGLGYGLYDFTSETFFKYIVNEDFLNVNHKFKVLAVSSTGKKLELGSVGFVAAIPLAKTAPPSDVTALYINVTGEVLQLDWPLVPDVDIEEYLIRYSPLSTSTWETSVPLLKAARNQSIVSVQARTGSYLIKAIDFAGNESLSYALSYTSIPELLKLNVIAEINDFPTLPGSTDRVVKVGDALVLQEEVAGGPGVSQYYSEGYYYFENLLDLGDIFTVRLQAKIEAEGYTLDDLMSSWVTLSSVAALSSSKFSEWDVELQYRGTSQYITMDTWTTLDSVTTLNSGVEDNWSPWRKLTNTGDFTARIFQFRLKLISNKVSVSPKVISAIVKADMPDRVDVYNNLTSLISGSTITYSKPFKGPGTSPSIQITSENMVSGDYYVISSKTLSGFNIIFYDSTDTAVVRQFDVGVSGFGAKSANTL